MFNSLFIVVPKLGLCNRMRVIHSAYCLSQSIKRKISILWIKDQGLNCAFSELFEPIESDYLQIKDCSGIESLLLSLGKRRNLYLPLLYQKAKFDIRLTDQKNQVLELMYADFNFNSLQDYKRVFISTCQDFYPPENNYQIFKPIAALQQKINEIVKDFHSDTVGVHIRRTDHTKSIHNSPLHRFQEEMEKEIVGSSKVRFYLATDDASVKEELVGEYPDKIITTQNSLSRSTTQGIQDALVELYVLGSTSKILGSYWSSYSEISSMLYQTPLVIVK